MSSPVASEKETSETSQIAALERALAEKQAEYERLAERERRNRMMLEAGREAIAVFDKGVVIDVNLPWANMTGYTPEDVIGRGAAEFIAPESMETVITHQRSGYALPYEATILRKDGSKFVASVLGRSMESDGHTFRVTVIHDLTEKKLAEEALSTAAVQKEMIRLQADLLARLSTPLLPIGGRALVLPLIGQINGTRAGQVLDAITEGIVAHGARYAIIDVTGVDTLDAQVAELLVSASKVTRLLGAQALLTGIRPDVARMLVEIGSDLSSLVTFATLEQGVAHAFGRKR